MLGRGPQLNQDGLKDGDHHGSGGGVGDPHGEKGSGEHETQHKAGKLRKVQHRRIKKDPRRVTTWGPQTARARSATRR